METEVIPKAKLVRRNPLMFDYRAPSEWGRGILKSVVYGAVCFPEVYDAVLNYSPMTVSRGWRFLLSSTHENVLRSIIGGARLDEKIEKAILLKRERYVDGQTRGNLGKGDTKSLIEKTVELIEAKAGTIDDGTQVCPDGMGFGDIKRLLDSLKHGKIEDETLRGICQSVYMPFSDFSGILGEINMFRSDRTDERRVRKRLIDFLVPFEKPIEEPDRYVDSDIYDHIEGGNVDFKSEDLFLSLNRADGDNNFQVGFWIRPVAVLACRLSHREGDMKGARLLYRSEGDKTVKLPQHLKRRLDDTQKLIMQAYSKGWEYVSMLFDSN